jgi:hypothetical protein
MSSTCDVPSIQVGKALRGPIRFRFLSKLLARLQLKLPLKASRFAYRPSVMLRRSWVYEHPVLFKDMISLRFQVFPNSSAQCIQECRSQSPSHRFKWGFVNSEHDNFRILYFFGLLSLRATVSLTFGPVIPRPTCCIPQKTHSREHRESDRKSNFEGLQLSRFRLPMPSCGTCCYNKTGICHLSAPQLLPLPTFLKTANITAPLAALKWTSGRRKPQQPNDAKCEMKSPRNEQLMRFSSLAMEVQHDHAVAL